MPRKRPRPLPEEEDMVPVEADPFCHLAGSWRKHGGTMYHSEVENSKGLRIPVGSVVCLDLFGHELRDMAEEVGERRINYYGLLLELHEGDARREEDGPQAVVRCIGYRRDEDAATAAWYWPTGYWWTQEEMRLPCSRIKGVAQALGPDGGVVSILGAQGVRASSCRCAHGVQCSCACS
jgi:hypothetical protein